MKKQKADIYVENNGTPEEMFTKTLQKLNKILGKKKKDWLIIKIPQILKPLCLLIIYMKVIYFASKIEHLWVASWY